MKLLLINIRFKPARQFKQERVATAENIQSVYILISREMQRVCLSEGEGDLIGIFSEGG